jgi:hypothetical protein
MKYSSPHTPRAASLKLPRNPTSTTTTVYQYAILLYLALSYILQDNPRHVQYRETQDEVGPQQRTSDLARGRLPTLNEHRQSLKILQDRAVTASTTRNPNRRQSRLRVQEQDQPSHLLIHIAATVIPLVTLAQSSLISTYQKAQMSEAWTRIRAVRHLPVRPADPRDRKDARKKRPKKVRWGVVQTRVFESDDGDEQRVKKTYKWDIGKKEKWLGREVWNGVEREDEHEVWGAPPPGHWEGRADGMASARVGCAGTYW